MNENSLFNHILSVNPTLIDFKEGIMQRFSKIEVKKGDVVFADSEKVNRYFFVETGFLHLYFNDKSGGKTTIHFALENWWLTDYKSFMALQPASLFIEAIEDSILWQISFEDYNVLLQTIPFIGAYFSHVHMKAYGAALVKQKTNALVSREDFYLYFHNTYPVLVRRIPDAIMASYMDVSMELFKDFQIKFPAKFNLKPEQLKYLSIAYLESGNEKQQKVFEVLSKYKIMERLQVYQPILVGTYPLGINVDKSDLDIICYTPQQAIFESLAQKEFGQYSNFKSWKNAVSSSFVCTFDLEGFTIEIYSQAVETQEQLAFRHMIIEDDILTMFGEEFKEKVIKLKQGGLKTEPAFAKLLDLKGNPYFELLKINQQEKLS